MITKKGYLRHMVVVNSAVGGIDNIPFGEREVFHKIIHTHIHTHPYTNK